MLSLHLVLRIVAVIMLLLMIVGYAVSVEMQIKTFVAANILFLLSMFGAGNLNRVAIISLILAIIISAGAIQSYLEKEVAIEFAVINVAMFVYLALVAINTIRIDKTKG